MKAIAVVFAAMLGVPGPSHAERPLPAAKDKPASAPSADKETAEKASSGAAGGSSRSEGADQANDHSTTARDHRNSSSKTPAAR